MLFRDFSSDRLADLPKVDRNDLRFLWHADYWDGPKSGELSYQDNKYWFEVFDELDNEKVFRRFLIVDLTPEQLSEEEYWHGLFRQKVGWHTDYDETGKRQVGTARPEATWHEFYDAYQGRLPLNLSDNQIIGWFEQ